MKRVLFSGLLILANAIAVSAQVDNSDVITVEYFLSVDAVRPGDQFKIGVLATLHGDWHINSHTPNEEFLIPTEISFEDVPGVEFGKIHYPNGHDLTLSFSETPLSVYDGATLFLIAARTTEEIEFGKMTINGTFRYQACNDMSCLIPTNEPIEITVPVHDEKAAVNAINQEKFSIEPAPLQTLQGERSQGQNEITNLIASQGLVLTLAVIFVGGLALNLTPCVYPIIPITISFFVGQSSGKLSKSVSLALFYVLGMSITYSALGVAAAMTGGILGSSLQNPLVLVGIACVFLIFAFSMFGGFEIRVPTFLNQLAGGSRQGYAGALFMGLTVGIVAAPCIGPFVLSLLTYVAAQGDPVLGFLMFFVLSLGLGLPYFVLGTFSGSLERLPQSGVWMIWVKKVFGVIMVAVAIYFINTLIPEPVYVALMTLTLVGGGVLIGFLDKSSANFDWFRPLKYLAGAAFILFGAWTSVSAWQTANAPQIAWQHYDEQLVTDAHAAGKPILIDFYADWCIPCKQIDANLFRATPVVDAAERFVALKADLTVEKSEEVELLRKRYGVHGVPTIILLGPDGKESRRFTDELVGFEPGEFVEIMAEVAR